MASISNTDIESPEWKQKLEDHLKSEDFFHTDSFPHAILEIKGPQSLIIENSKKSDQILADFSRSVELEGNNSNAVVLSNYFKATVKGVGKDSITKEEAFSIYLKIIPIIEHNIKQRENAQKPREVKKRGDFFKTRNKINN